MKTISYYGKIITFSDKTTADEIMKALKGKEGFECCRDFELNHDEFKFFDMVEWQWVFIDIEEVEIINL